MAYCIKCGAKVEDNTKYCQQCGAQIPGYKEKQQEYSYEHNTYNDTQHFDPHQVQRNKAMGVLSYLGLLVFIPILAGDRKCEYVRFHANQGLVLFIVSVICNLLSGDWFFGFHSFINLGWWLSWVFNLIDLVIFIFMIVGIVYACRGEKRELPIVGQIHILGR